MSSVISDRNRHVTTSIGFPFSPGEVIYVILLNEILPFVITSIRCSSSPESPEVYAEHGISLIYRFSARQIGKDVFLSRQEAETEREKRSKKYKTDLKSI